MRMLKFRINQLCSAQHQRFVAYKRFSAWQKLNVYFITASLLICNLLLNNLIAENDDDSAGSLLENAYELRSANPAKSQSLLDKISRQSLNALQQDKYDYLHAYSHFMSGDIDSAIIAFSSLADAAKTEEYKQTAQASLLSLYSGTQSWAQALAMFERVLPYTRIENTSPSREDSLTAVMNFYNQVDELDLQIEYIEPLLTQNLSLRFKCHAYYEWFNAMVEIRLEELDKVDFENALKACSTLDEPIIKFALIENFARYYFYSGQVNQSLDLINSYLEEAVDVGYIALTQEFYDLLGLIYFDLGDLDKAKEFATKATKLELLDVATPSNISAHETLYNVAELEKDFELALTHFKTYTELKARNIDSVNAKHLAVQKARYDSEQKSSKIELLDKENALLKANAMLAEEGNLNRNLMILIACMMCVGLLIWLIKKHKSYVHMRDLSQKDDLTGLANSRYFRSRASLMLRQAKAQNKTISFVIFDLDDFKKINDEYGHRIGDFALKSAAKAAASRCRNNDFIGRLGGEEFGIILDGCNIAQAKQIAESCRQEIEKILQKNNLMFKVTASFGIADSDSSKYSFETLFNRADRAMYNAKRKGKNRVECEY